MSTVIDLWLVLARSLVCLVRGHRFPVYSFCTDYEYFCVRCAKPLIDCKRLDNSPMTDQEREEAEWMESLQRERDSE